MPLSEQIRVARWTLILTGGMSILMIPYLVWFGLVELISTRFWSQAVTLPLFLLMAIHNARVLRDLRAMQAEHGPDFLPVQRKADRRGFATLAVTLIVPLAAMSTAIYLKQDPDVLFITWMSTITLMSAPLVLAGFLRSAAESDQGAG